MFRALRRKHPTNGLGRVLLYDLTCLALRTGLTALYRPIVQGVERVPADGPLLIACNHQSYFDPPFVGCWIKQRHFDFIARAGLFKNPVFGAVISAVNALPISEEGSDAAAIKETLRRLGEGRAILIFPEGARTPDGTVGTYKRGVEVLLRRGGCPVVPVAIEGVYDTYPRSRRFPRLLGCRLAVRFGDPIDPSARPKGAPPLVEELRAWADRARLELRAELRARTRGRFPPQGPADTAGTMVDAAPEAGA